MSFQYVWTGIIECEANSSLWRQTDRRNAEALIVHALPAVLVTFVVWWVCIVKWLFARSWQETVRGVIFDSRPHMWLIGVLAFEEFCSFLYQHFFTKSIMPRLIVKIIRPLTGKKKKNRNCIRAYDYWRYINDAVLSLFHNKSVFILVVNLPSLIAV